MFPVLFVMSSSVIIKSRNGTNRGKCSLLRTCFRLCIHCLIEIDFIKCLLSVILFVCLSISSKELIFMSRRSNFALTHKQSTPHCLSLSLHFKGSDLFGSLSHTRTHAQTHTNTRARARGGSDKKLSWVF